MRRAENAPTVLLQARVSPQVRAEIKAAAEANGVSISYYMEALVDAMIRDQGSLPAIDLPRAQDQELPIPAA